jgi:hypothetical protein
MSRRKLVAAAVLALVSLTGALLEASFVHTDDGCAIETHCDACLLRLRTAGVVTVTFSLPPVVTAGEAVAPAAAPGRVAATPRSVATRRPPLA